MAARDFRCDDASSVSTPVSGVPAEQQSVCPVSYTHLDVYKRQVLHNPQHERKYIIYSDASDYAIGSVLYQEGSRGGLQVIAYESRVSKIAEKH